MDNKDLYIFISKVALEFRLSLDNVCRLLGKEPTDQNKMEVYEKIMALTPGLDEKNSYSYLFNYETINEDSKLSLKTYATARLFLKKYQEALKEKNQEKINSLRKELSKTDTEFNRIKKVGETDYTEEEIIAIAKYRLKHCISKTKMEYILDIDRRSLLNLENKLTNQVLKDKLVKLSEFYHVIGLDYLKKKSK